MKTPAKYIVGTSTLPFNPATFEEVKTIDISPLHLSLAAVFNINYSLVSIEPTISNRHLPFLFFSSCFFFLLSFRLCCISGCVWLIVLEPHLLRKVWSTCRMTLLLLAGMFGLCSQLKVHPLPLRLKEETPIRFRSTWICCSSCCRPLEVKNQK